MGRPAVGYLYDVHNARLAVEKPTGNGRRESHAHPPLPRTTHTFMLAGGYPPEEILASVRQGLFVARIGGGQVNITNGNFVFTADLAYRIENGRLSAPVRGATLIDNGLATMTRIGMVGNDLDMDREAKTCGKEGQRVPVGVGQSTLRIDGMTVGGTG